MDATSDDQSALEDFKTFLLLWERHFWTGRQFLNEKLGRIEKDEFTSASDLLLDVKVAYLNTIPESLGALIKVLSIHRKRHKELIRREKKLGCFLDQNGKLDNTSASKALRVTGQFLFFISQTRKSLDTPLERIYHRLVSFQKNALTDILDSVQDMQESRTIYKGSLSWVRRISEITHPDEPASMKRFHMVQHLVKANKARFDKRNQDCMQKIALLSLSQCNLFSTYLPDYIDKFCSMCKEVTSLADFASRVVQSTSSQSLSLTLQSLLHVADDRPNNKRVATKESRRDSPRFDLMNIDDSTNLGVRNRRDSWTSGSDVSSEKIQVIDEGSCLTYLPSQDLGLPPPTTPLSNAQNLSSWLDLLNEFDPLNSTFKADISECC